MKTQLKIQMLGCSFSIQTDHTKEHIEEVLYCLNQKISEVLEKNAGIEPVKTALLAGLNLADELVRMKKNAVQGGSPAVSPADEIETIADHIIQRIDDALTGQEPSVPEGT
ncbi:MAG: cell division protein ZapA [Spirochaetales bacterium]|nr:cell division protein ZapA [Spirochaetales bacterium]